MRKGRTGLTGSSELIFLATFISALLALLPASATFGYDEAPPLLGSVQKETQAVLDKMTGSLASAATKLAAEDLSGAQARKVLKGVCALDPSVVDCATLSPEGLVLAVEPEAFKHLEGWNTSERAEVALLLKTTRPVFSAPFRTIEGFDAVALHFPVLDAAGKLRGAVSLLVRPETLFVKIIEPRAAGTPFGLWALDSSGRILYDADAAAIGRDLTKDPAYAGNPSLVAAARKVIGADEGALRYATKGRGPETAEAHWVTVSELGVGWRIVLTHAVVSGPAEAPETRGELGLVIRGDSLRDFARDDELVAALKSKDAAKVMEIFRRFYDANPGLYSVQWVDAKGVNRCGYPVENSLTGYDFHGAGAVKATHTLKALEGRKETLFEEPLIEGGTGRFHFAPAFEGTTFLGMVYTIRVNP